MQFFRIVPILSACEELNQSDVLLISTPMWNFSVPYVLKQYLDTVLQPGFSIHDSLLPDNMAMFPGRIAVTFARW